MKLISVIIPVYKAEKYIHDTVQSVLNQTYKNLEILIIDDGSPDRSIEICQKFPDSRIKILRQANRGVAAARNKGINHAQGEYLAFLDADDLWVPEKLEKHIQHLEESPSVGVSFSFSSFIDEMGKPLGIYQISKVNKISPPYILCRNPLGNGSTPVIRREVFEGIKYQANLYGTVEDFYFDEDKQLHPSEDVEFWFRIAVQTDWKLEGIPEALTLYRVNSVGFSANLLRKLDSWKKLLEKGRSYAPELISRWENPSMAYQLRYLARRAVTLRASSMAVELSHQALATHWRILLEEPRRTILTLAAAYMQSLLPQSFYKNMETYAMKTTGANQRNRILQKQF